ncbi:hypothetical protein [Halorussus lipolyticus]|uniref:hypothetical protein n=1 Tax=Halorussus lipolyticus TaxID=3034024 RepID=UPI0023E8DBC4|nr:hypothetical protein [Halorussus sp. DT80]
MTDAAHPVTQSALEAFAREYLTGLGASVRESDARWRVNLPAHVDVDFADEREFEVAVGPDRPASDESERALTPQSEFARRLLAEAAEMAPAGRVALTKDLLDGDYRYPSWVAESSADVADATFSPYYDRTGLWALVRIDVETVSEYQTQLLEAVALDVESEDPLPGVAELLVEEFYGLQSGPPRGAATATETDDAPISTEKLADAADTAQRTALEAVRDEIDDIRRSASRAAESEFEEYRRLREQRIEELRDEVRSLADRLRDVATEAEGVRSDERRVAVLEERQELKAEKEDVQTALDEARRERERGYAEKRREIYDRHAVEIATELVAGTVVTYERGEIDLTVRDDGRSETLRAPYAVGAGVTDDVRCDCCGERLTARNPIRVTATGLGCRTCR